MKTGEAFNTGCGGGCGLVIGIIAAIILIPVVTIIGCVALTGGVFVVAPAVDAARDAAKRAAEKEAGTTAIPSAAKEMPPEAKLVPEQKTAAAEAPVDPTATKPTEPQSSLPEETTDQQPVDSALNSSLQQPIPPIVNVNLRTWTSASGEYRVDAEFVSMAAGKVKLKKADGTILTLPMAKLSNEDREWIRKRGR
jgi:hypothetical protein